MGRDIKMKMLSWVWISAQFAALASLFVPLSLLLSALLISQQWALFLQMAPQSAVYLASPNLWVYANGEPGWGPCECAHFNDNVLLWWYWKSSGREVCVWVRGGVRVAVSVEMGWGHKRLSVHPQSSRDSWGSPLAFKSPESRRTPTSFKTHRGA